MSDAVFQNRDKWNPNWRTESGFKEPTLVDGKFKNQAELDSFNALIKSSIQEAPVTGWDRGGAMHGSLTPQQMNQNNARELAYDFAYRNGIMKRPVHQGVGLTTHDFMADVLPILAMLAAPAAGLAGVGAGAAGAGLSSDELITMGGGASAATANAEFAATVGGLTSDELLTMGGGGPSGTANAEFGDFVGAGGGANAAPGGSGNPQAATKPVGAPKFVLPDMSKELGMLLAGALLSGGLDKASDASSIGTEPPPRPDLTSPEDNPQVEHAATRQKRKNASDIGRFDTILTGPMGLKDDLLGGMLPIKYGRKTLLGS